MNVFPCVLIFLFSSIAANNAVAFVPHHVLSSPTPTRQHFDDFLPLVAQGEGVSNKEDETTEKNEKRSEETADLTNILESIGNYEVRNVIGNLADPREFGSRGEVYFLSQAILVPCVLLGGIPVVGDGLREIAGAGVLLLGFTIATASFLDLGDESLSPFPKPTATGTLKTTGVYQQMRHPMYTGLLSMLVGFSLLTNSLDRLLLTMLLAYLIDQKADKEEDYLMEQFPEEYPQYKVRIMCYDTYTILCPKMSVCRSLKISLIFDLM